MKNILFIILIIILSITITFQFFDNRRLQKQVILYTNNYNNISLYKKHSDSLSILNSLLYTKSDSLLVSIHILESELELLKLQHEQNANYILSLPADSQIMLFTRLTNNFN